MTADPDPAVAGGRSAPLTFASFGLPPVLVDALAQQRITEPTEIQTATLGDLLAGTDVVGQAPTGSGKTLAFGLPLLARVGDAAPRRPRALVLVPTRELAEQISLQLGPLARTVGRAVVPVYGGVGFGDQTRALDRGADVVVATPGRLEDLIDQGRVTLDATDIVVVDEADRMADMGFMPAVRRLLDQAAGDRQTVLFSATIDGDVDELVERYLRQPVRHRIGGDDIDLSRATHRFLSTRNKEDKIGLAADLIDTHGSSMVFCRTRHGVDRVARQLRQLGVRAGWIHGGRTQAQREAALRAFATGKVTALVATDVAARGIHVDEVACVIHYDPPADAKDYVHRSGRTARAGASGDVVSLVNRDQRRAVNRLRAELGLPAGDFEPAPPLSVRDLPPWVDRRSGDHQSRSGSESRRSARPRHPTDPPATDENRPDTRPTRRATDENRPATRGNRSRHPTDPPGHRRRDPDEP